MWSELRNVLGEVGAERPPGPAPWDKKLALGFAPVFVAEGVLRGELALRPLQVAAGFAILGAVLLRRPHPLAATVAGFGLATGCSLLLQVMGHPQAAPYANAIVLLLPYSLLRWGSARDVVLGLLALVVVYATAGLRGELHGAGEAIGAALVMLFPGVLGLSARFRADAHARDLEHVKLRERAELARDLHDTVAHHVAAIAIQAQAGRAVLATRPDRAAATLEAIEKEAARTLAELRGMVGALREREPEAASLAPQRGLSELYELGRARLDGHGLAVEVELDDDLRSIRPAVQTALFRIAQESITNTLRHAKGASRARIRVVSQGEGVRMTVEDDGTSTTRRGSGFGLIGMAERAALLGGRLEAGPCEDGGWRVEVALPFERDAR